MGLGAENDGGATDDGGAEKDWLAGGAVGRAGAGAGGGAAGRGGGGGSLPPIVTASAWAPERRGGPPCGGPPLGPGERCIDELNVMKLPCINGYGCDGETCVPSLSEGETCSFSATLGRTCGRDLRCEGDPPRCVRNVPLALGDHCLNRGPCADGICDDATFKCVPAPPLGDPRACR